MREPLSKLLERVEVFDDSEYFAAILMRMAEDNESMECSGYDLRESSMNLTGMFELLCDIKKELEMKASEL